MVIEETSSEYTFEAFARQPFYRRVNRELVSMVPLSAGMTVVDAGAGTGEISTLILEKIDAPDSTLIMVEPSASALQTLKARFSGCKSRCVFVASLVEKLCSVLGGFRGLVDAVFFCNAIHLISDKLTTAREIFGALRSGGRFAFNTTFFSGSNPPEAEVFYRRWMTKALRKLVGEYRLKPAPQKAQARRQLTTVHYRQLLEETGFVVEKMECKLVEVPLEGWLSICGFSDFIEGTLLGVPLPVASSVLRDTVRQVFEQMGISAVPRYWLQVVALRP